MLAKNKLILTAEWLHINVHFDLLEPVALFFYAHWSLSAFAIGIAFTTDDTIQKASMWWAGELF